MKNLFIFFALFISFTAANAQTFVKHAVRPQGDTVQIFSDYGTDNYYFGKDSTKVYCATSPMPTQAITQTTLTAGNLQPIKPSITTNTIASKPTVIQPDTVIFYHTGNETPELCTNYLQAHTKPYTVVVDSISPTASQEYIALLAEIKAINKQIGYHSKVQNKAIRKQQKETFLASLAYNNCKHRPTIAGYLGLYPIHFIAEHTKNLFWAVIKLGKNKKINQLTITKKRLLARKKNLLLTYNK